MNYFTFAETNLGNSYLYFMSFIEFGIDSGQWENDKASGYGILEQNNGDVYDGQWFDDRRHGKQIDTT